MKSLNSFTMSIYVAFSFVIVPFVCYLTHRGVMYYLTGYDYETALRLSQDFWHRNIFSASHFWTGTITLLLIAAAELRELRRSR